MQKLSDSPSAKSSGSPSVPEAVRRLRLVSALNHDCGKSDVTDCIRESAAGCMYVYDDSGLGFTDWSETAPEFEAKCFRALNDGHVSIVLLPLDNRIVTGEAVKKGGVADCALLTEREMAFVEFKTNASTTSRIESHDQKAIRQLWHTFADIIEPRCRQRKIDIKSKVSVEFYVVFDRDFDVTSASASRQAAMTEFLMQHKLPLFFANEKKFE